MSMLTMRGTSFDNRSFPQTTLLRLRGGFGHPHFCLEFSGQRIVYCYIRKNACTAFKRLIVDYSSGPGLGAGEEAIDYLLQHHRAEYRRDIAGADRVLFVYRDPIDRSISLFKNKFIQRAGNGDIFHDYERVTGASPATATFEDFVVRYLGSESGTNDPHTRPQRSHLLPIVYTDAIPLTMLHERMAELLDGQTAGAYFGRKLNASGNAAARDVPLASVTPADELRRAWLHDNSLPSRTSFLAGESDLEHRLRSIYAHDAAFFGS